ncbi:PREDICTED: histone H2B.2-like [Camelina sativa]|uniref:Histone H2B.2-like n=1 Tax=Camelina sativa TaxID=90675 RepID=A0ABM0VLJ9_CAMSA|nr:PREDICTED: histone H2B.2-like [Camelina sativa]
MAPRKPKVVSVTKKKKVVEETVKVTVTEGEDPNVTTEITENDQETQDLTFSIPVGENVTTVEIPVEVPVERSPQPPETPASTSEGTVKKKANKVEEKKKKKKKRDDLAGDEYRRYVYKVLKQVHPELGITSKAMTVVNMFMGDMFERIAQEAARLGDYTKRRTLSSREIESAVRLVLPGELSRHAVAEGSKAINNYVAYDSRKRWF